MAPLADTSNDRAIAIVLATQPSLEKLDNGQPRPDTSNDSAIAALLATQRSVPKALPAMPPPPQVPPPPPNSTSTPAVPHGIVPLAGGGASALPVDTSSDRAIATVFASEPSASRPLLAGSDPPLSAFADTSDDSQPELVADLQRDFSISQQLSSAPSMQIMPRVNTILQPTLTGNDHRDRLLMRLAQYNLTEKEVTGDGACQFRALSDQLFGTPEHYKAVRSAVIKQLRHDHKKYAAYVPTDYKQYLKDMSQPTTWGDHVTLQAAADTYGCRIEVLTSYPENYVIKITPSKIKSRRVVWLSFWAELHYNSILLKPDPTSGEVGTSTLTAQGHTARPSSQRRRRSSWSGADLGPRPPLQDAYLHAPRTGLLAKSTKVIGTVLTLGLKR